MELPMAQQPQMQPQVQPQQEPQKGPFPADKEEALKFSNDILQVLHDEKTHPNIVKQLGNIDETNKGEGLGVVSANIVGNRIADVRGQTNRQIEMKLVVGALKAVINETAEMAEDNGFFKVAPKDKKVAIETAVGVLDKMGAKK